MLPPQWSLEPSEPVPRGAKGLQRTVSSPTFPNSSWVFCTFWQALGAAHNDAAGRRRRSSSARQVRSAERRNATCAAVEGRRRTAGFGAG